MLQKFIDLRYRNSGGTEEKNQKMRELAERVNCFLCIVVFGRLYDYIAFNATFNSISVISRWSVQLSMLSCSSLTLSQTSPGIYLSSTSLLKTLWEKEKLLATSNFSFSHSVFYPFGKLSAIFINFKIVV